MRYENEIVGKDAGKAPPPEHIEPAEDVSVARNSLLLLRDCVIAFIVILAVLQFVKPTIVFEHSMENTLHPEDYVFLYRQAYTFGEIEYGDIIVFVSALPDGHGASKNLIKRVIGLPGDVISVEGDSVYRNGERLDEPYTKDGVTLGEMDSVQVPPDSYFVMGDNRQVSLDSRSPDVGFIHKDRIQGKVFFRLFPISSAGRVY